MYGFASASSSSEANASRRSAIQAFSIAGHGIMPPVSDERITRGMESQLADLRRELDRDERPLGWKLGFGTESAMKTLGTDAPLVGYLVGANRLESGAVVDITNWGNPRLEPEIVARVGEKGEITAIGAAIELVDPDPRARDPQ